MAVLPLSPRPGEEGSRGGEGRPGADAGVARAREGGRPPGAGARGDGDRGTATHAVLAQGKAVEIVGWSETLVVPRQYLRAFTFFSFLLVLAFGLRTIQCRHSK